MRGQDGSPETESRQAPHPTCAACRLRGEHCVKAFSISDGFLRPQERRVVGKVCAQPRRSQKAQNPQPRPALVCHVAEGRQDPGCAVVSTCPCWASAWGPAPGDKEASQLCSVHSFPLTNLPKSPCKETAVREENRATTKGIRWPHSPMLRVWRTGVTDSKQNVGRKLPAGRASLSRPADPHRHGRPQT